MTTLAIKDGNNSEKLIEAIMNADGDLSTIGISKSFLLAVTMGMVEGFSTVDKFGLNRLITEASDPEDAWENGGVYPEDAFGTAPVVSVASSSAADTGLVSIQGLDITGAEVDVPVVLQGTTRVPLPTALWKCHRVENESTVDFDGNIFVYTGTGGAPSVGDSNVRALVYKVGNEVINQTQQAYYTIPLGKIGFLHKGEIGMEYTAGGFFATPAACRCSYKSKRNGGVFKTKKSITLISSGTSNYVDIRSFPDIIPDLTSLKISIDEVSDDMGVWGSFDILLVDESYFPAAFLQAIGQTGA